MKLFSTATLIFTTLLSLQAQEKSVLIPDRSRNEFLKLQVKSLRLADQFKQLELAKQDIVKQFSDLQPSIVTKTKELTDFCESKGQIFVTSSEDFNCEPKKIEEKKKEEKKVEVKK